MPILVAAMMGLGATTTERWMKKQQLWTQERGSGLANSEICQMRVFNLRFFKGVDVFCDFAFKNCGKSSRLLRPLFHILTFSIPSRISSPFPPPPFPLEQPSSIHAFPLEYLLYIVAPSVRCVEQIGIDAPPTPRLRRRFRCGRPKRTNGQQQCLKKFPPLPFKIAFFLDEDEEEIWCPGRAQVAKTGGGRCGIRQTRRVRTTGGRCKAIESLANVLSCSKHFFRPPPLFPSFLSPLAFVRII